MTLAEALKTLREVPPESLSPSQLADLQSCIERNPSINGLVGGRAKVDAYLRTASGNATMATSPTPLASVATKGDGASSRYGGYAIAAATLLGILILAIIAVSTLFPKEDQVAATTTTAATTASESLSDDELDTTSILQSQSLPQDENQPGPEDASQPEVNVQDVDVPPPPAPTGFLIPEPANDSPDSLDSPANDEEMIPPPPGPEVQADVDSVQPQPQPPMPGQDLAQAEVPEGMPTPLVPLPLEPMPLVPMPEVPREPPMEKVKVEEQVLVGHWRLDEITDQKVSSINGEHLGKIQFASGEPKLVEGRSGKAIEFSGQGDAISIPLSMKAEEITLTAWVKGTRMSNWTGIVFCECDDGGRIGMGFTRYGHNLSYHWTKSAGLPHRWSGPAIPKDRWAMIAVTITADTATAYVFVPGEGLKKSEHKQTHPLMTINRVLIGQDPIGQGRYFNGAIDDVRLYNRALTETEIEWLAK